MEATEAAYKYWQEQKRQEAEAAAKEQAKSVSNNNNNSNSSSSSSSGRGAGSGGDGVPRVGDICTYIGGTYYYDSYGTNPSGRARSGTIKYINPKGSHPYNIEGLGWVKKTDIVGYNKGGYVNYTGIAAVHGKANKPEAFLNARQTALPASGQRRT